MTPAEIVCRSTSKFNGSAISGPLALPTTTWAEVSSTHFSSIDLDQGWSRRALVSVRLDRTLAATCEANLASRQRAAPARSIGACHPAIGSARQRRQFDGRY